MTTAVPDAASEADGQPNAEENRLVLAKVMAEIDEEVERRRSSGDMPPRLEHELDELFLRYSPMAGRDGSLEEALGVVESTSFIDPVVPVMSSRSGGALLKRTIRQASLWYVGWVTAQISQFASATARTLRVLDDRVRALQSEFDAQRIPPAPVLETPWAHGPAAWWVDRAVSELRARPGRVLHAASADGWLVRRLADEGLDAYGVEPREGRIDRAEVEGLDLREEPVLDHLRAVGAESLSGLVLSGVLDAMTAPERDTAVQLVARAVGPGGRLIVHSLSQQGVDSDRAPVEADLASGRPLRPGTWSVVLGRHGFAVEVVERAEGLDYLVVASRADGGEEGGAAAG